MVSPSPKSPSTSRKRRQQRREAESDDEHQREQVQSQDLDPSSSSPPVLADPNEMPPVWTLWAAASYAIIMLFIGLPLWWKTTTVERAPLPYDEMLSLYEQFQSDEFIIPLKVLAKGFPSSISSEGHPWTYLSGSLSTEELNIMERSESLEAIDGSLCKVQHGSQQKSEAHLSIYNIKNPNVYKIYGEEIVIGNCRNIYAISNSSKVNVEKLNFLLKEFDTVANTDEDLPLAVSYNILFTLIVPEPELFDVTWQIDKGVNDYIQPMLNLLTPFSSFFTRGQTLFYHKLNLKPNFVNGVYQIPYDQLPLVINPVETKLTSFVSDNPVFNFLVYISPCDVTPLQILDEDGTILKTNAFYVPQWGGIQIYNSQCNSNRTPTFHELDMKKVISIVITQIRDLIDVPKLGSSLLTDERITVMDFYGSALRDWEVDLVMRKRLAKLLETSSNTLKSLGSLLEQITNIVVTEQVGNEVHRSVESLKLAYKEALFGNITESLEFAQIAYTSSEIAFHHPSNLAQLYFPDDQKYAIYIPLYLPVGIPVLLSLRGLIKYCLILWKQRKGKLD